MGLQAGKEKWGETRHGLGEQPGEQRPGCGWSANLQEQVHMLSRWPLRAPFFLLTSYSNLFMKGKACLGCPSTEANKAERRKARTFGWVTWSRFAAGIG